MEAGGFSEFWYTGQGLTLRRTLLALFLLFPLVWLCLYKTVFCVPKISFQSLLLNKVFNSPYRPIVGLCLKKT